jgi:UV DNA damage endonuclease
MFKEYPIKYRTTTIKTLLTKKREDALKHLGEICFHNIESVYKSLKYCFIKRIPSFRISSDLFPCYTHPEHGYILDDLPNSDEIKTQLKLCGDFILKYKIRTTCHPDHFVVLNSPNQDIVEKSIKDLEYHVLLANYLHIDVMNIHGGGGYKNKKLALERLTTVIKSLPSSIKTILTLENDDRVFTVEDLYPVCMETNIPLVYDVHHHRCLPDSYSISEATSKAIETWRNVNRIPLFHISSPRDSWSAKNCRPHHDMIDPKDFPNEWLSFKNTNYTIDVEAKSKECAVLELYNYLENFVTH